MEAQYQTASSRRPCSPARKNSLSGCRHEGLFDFSSAESNLHLRGTPAWTCCGRGRWGPATEIAEHQSHVRACATTLVESWRIRTRNATPLSERSGQEEHP